MKLDMELVRDILFALERPEFDGSPHGVTEAADLNLESYSNGEVIYHLSLLIQAGYLNGKINGNFIVLKTMTWEGHQFLDNVRNPEIWTKTKEGANKLGGFSLDLVGSLAKGLLKKQIEKYTGVEIEL